MHHEVQVLPDGRVLYVSRDVLCEAPVPQEGDTLGIWDAEVGTSAIIRNIFDHLSPADSRGTPLVRRALRYKKP